MNPAANSFCYLFTDGPALFLVKVAQALLHRLGAWVDFQSMLSDLPRDAWHIRGFPRKDVLVIVEEVDERTFLFGGEHGINAYLFSLGAAGVHEDLLGAFYRFERPGRFLRVGSFFVDLLLEGGEFPRDDDCCGMAAPLDLALVGPLEGGANGDDPMGPDIFSLRYV